MFEIAHDSDILPKKSHCSVMEFTAPEGSVYLPIWMIDNLGLDPQGESVIELTTVSLPKGQFVQFQAHETKFAMLNNPRVVLEKNLRSYSCLTVGDTIQIEFANHIYKLDVTEVRPSIPRGNAPPAISIIETDIKVDFKEPRDYKEWEKKNKGKNWNKKKAEEKIDEEEEDDFGVVIDPIKNANKTKSDYFRSLEESGFHAQKLKKQKSNKALSPKSPQSTNNNNNNNNSDILGGIVNPYSSRGSPLGKSRGKPLGSSGGKCEYHKPKYVNGSMAMGSIIRQKSTKTFKEEEIVGSMRYIYEVDEHGNRTLVRRLPVRNIAVTNTGKGHSLK